jgi:hypothetical protein
LDDQQLRRFCFNIRHTPQHALGENISGAPQTLSSELRCPIAGCQANNLVNGGVFFSHLGCEATNPFWDPSKNRIVLPSGEGETMPYTDGGGSQVLQHWQIAMLRALGDHKKLPALAYQREMWFPAMLLRAMSETVPGQPKRRIGQLVELCGSTGAGKTVLAMQAMHEQGYYDLLEQDSFFLRLENFLYCRTAEGSADSPLLPLLCLAGRLERAGGESLFLPEGTQEKIGDLKAVFFRPVLPPAPEETAPAAPAQTTGRPSGQTWRETILASAKKAAGEVLQDFVGKSPQESNGDAPLPENDAPYYYTLIFYDTAGETHKKAAQALDPDTNILGWIETAVDKVAVVLDATEIFELPGPDGQVSTETLIRAVARLKRIEERNLPYCFVVTKLDLLLETLSREGQTPPLEIGRNQLESFIKDYQQQHAKEAQGLLKQWLALSPGFNHRKLREYLTLSDARVFFVKNLHLPTRVAGESVQEVEPSVSSPQSFGLTAFVSWCLGLEWKDFAGNLNSGP